MKAKITRMLLPILLLLQPIPSAAQEWNQWRGANRNGVANSFAAPARWPEKLTKKWMTDVGGGYSSPVVWRSKIYIHTRRDDREVVSCLDWKTGKLVWSQSYVAPFAKNQYAVRMGKGPNSTPVLYAGNLYTLGVTAVLSCFDAKTGRVNWRKDFSQFIDTSKLFCGTAMSPVIDQGSLLVHVGDDRKGWVIAFDAVTGNERWRWEGDGPSYASPLIIEIEGVRQFVTLTDKSVIGLESRTGKLLWKFPHPDEWNENIITPVLYQNRLILSGVRQGTRAIRITKEKELWSAVELWHNAKIAMYMSSPVLDGDYLYGLSSLRKGQFFCLDARTGATLWATEGRAATNASVLSAKNFIFSLTDDAELIVAAKNAQSYAPLAKYTVADSPTWAQPVLYGKEILIKDEANLILWSVE
jgi:outer membrane protein assembly factor BamB